MQKAVEGVREKEGEIDRKRVRESERDSKREGGMREKEKGREKERESERLRQRVRDDSIRVLLKRKKKIEIRN